MTAPILIYRVFILAQISFIDNGCCVFDRGQHHYDCVVSNFSLSREASA